MTRTHRNQPLHARSPYEAGDLASSAAAYAFGLARNPAFIDGNKRIAFVAMVVFLRLNGVPFKPERGDLGDPQPSRR